MNAAIITFLVLSCGAAINDKAPAKSPYPKPDEQAVELPKAVKVGTIGGEVDTIERLETHDSICYFLFTYGGSSISCVRK